MGEEGDALGAAVGIGECVETSEEAAAVGADEDQHNESNVDETVKLQLFAAVFWLYAAFCEVSLIALAFDDIVDSEQHDGSEEVHWPEMGQAPEEWNATQITHEEWWVTEWGQAAADVADEEDKENDGVHLVLTPFIGTDDRTDQHHGSTGGPDDGSQNGTDCQNSGVELRRADERATDHDAACSCIQSDEQKQEWEIVEGDGVDQFKDGDVRTERDKERYDEHSGPEQGHPQLILFPPFAFDEWENCNGQEHADEWGDTPDRKLIAEHLTFRKSCGWQKHGEHNQCQD